MFDSVLVIALEMLFCRNNYEAYNASTLLQRVFAFASARHVGALSVWNRLFQVCYFLDSSRDSYYVLILFRLFQFLFLSL